MHADHVLAMGVGPLGDHSVTISSFIPTATSSLGYTGVCAGVKYVSCSVVSLLCCYICATCLPCPPFSACDCLGTLCPYACVHPTPWNHSPTNLVPSFPLLSIHMHPLS